MESDEEVEVIQGIVRRGFWIRMVQATIGGDNCFSRDATTRQITSTKNEMISTKNDQEAHHIANIHSTNVQSSLLP